MINHFLKIILILIFTVGIALAHEDNDKKGGEPDTFSLLDFDTIQ